MTTLGDADDLKIMYESIADDIDDTTVTLVMTMADLWVTRKIAELSEVPSAEVQGQASNLYAMALILRMVYDTDSEESTTANWYEEQAREILGLTSGDDDKQKYFYGNFYASSKTPTDQTLADRNKTRRKTFPYEEYKFYITG